MPFKVGQVTVDWDGFQKWKRKIKFEGTIEIGLFDAKNASKGWKLEMGATITNGNTVTVQPARPWLKGAFLKQSGSAKVRKVLEREIVKVFSGSQTMDGVAEEVAKEVQNYLLGQRFNLVPLKRVTVNLKTLKGSAFPSHIGIETGEMLDAIEGRFTRQPGRR